MNKYTDLFIDFDDTLYDTRGNAVISLCELFDYYGWSKNFNSPQEFYDNYWETNVILWSEYAQGKITRDHLIYERFRRPLSVGKGIDLSREFCLQVSDKFLELGSVKSGVIEGAHELVRYLKDKGYRMHICSNGFHEVQYKKLKACGLFPYFDSICLSEDAGANKPSKQFFDYAFKHSGAKPETTLMIGDNFVTDIQGAQKAGLDVMFFNMHPDKFTAPAPVNFEIHKLKDAMNIL